MTYSIIKNVKYINIYIFPCMKLVPTYGHQQHIIWTSFSKCMEIHVQIKYDRLNDDDLPYQSPS